MLETSKVAMDVIALANGHFAVRSIGADLLSRIQGEFESRAEAEAWILRHAMADGAAAFGTGVIRPGDGQGVA